METKASSADMLKKLWKNLNNYVKYHKVFPLRIKEN
jgi:hypothetical protein